MAAIFYRPARLYFAHCRRCCNSYWNMHASSFGKTGLADPALDRDSSATAGIDTTAAARRYSIRTRPRRSLLTVGVRIGAGFGVALLLLALFGVAVNSRLKTAAEERQWVQHSLEVLNGNEHAVRPDPPGGGSDSRLQTDRPRRCSASSSIPRSSMSSARSPNSGRSRRTTPPSSN